MTAAFEPRKRSIDDPLHLEQGEDMLITLPPPAAIIAGRKARATRYCALTLGSGEIPRRLVTVQNTAVVDETGAVEQHVDGADLGAAAAPAPSSTSGTAP